MTERQLVRLAVWLMVAAILVSFVAVWWWALLGMTPEVGLACLFTATLLAGCACWAMAVSPGR
jgi:hypothetical protein